MHRTLFTAVSVIAAICTTQTSALSSPAKVTVFGGTGYVGSAVCERLVKKGYEVTGASRRGTNPRPGDKNLDKVNWVKCDATNSNDVNQAVANADAVVHAVGLLFDVNSGLTDLNKFTSASGSVPGEDSTYDNITRKTMFNVIKAVEAKVKNPLRGLTGGGSGKIPLCFVSAAEVGWPDVKFGSTVEDKLAPEWLVRYLVAKRAVEERLGTSSAIRSVIYRPSLIWDWTKFDVLPVIPVFNIANFLGVPFVDKTVRVETLADAIVSGIENDNISGVQRYMKMEELAKQQ